MQQIERVGVIALLLMVVTIVVVALWDDDGESPNQAQASVEEPAKKERPGEPVAASERVRPDASGLRSTRANTRERPTVPLGSRPSARDDGSVPRPRALEASPRRRPGSDPREEERARGTHVALSVPEPQTQPQTQPQPARVTPSRTGTGPVAAGIEFDPRRTNETRKPPRTSPAAQPVSVRPASTPKSNGVAGATYVVEPGDSLERIARRLLGKGSRWPELQALNGIADPLKLHVGMKLKLPGGPEPAPAAQAPGRGPAGGKTYVVQAGDILGRIAQRELGSARYWRRIVELNPKVDPERLLVGARLVLPDVGSPVEKSEPRRLVAKADPRVDSSYQVR